MQRSGVEKRKETLAMPHQGKDWFELSPIPNVWNITAGAVFKTALMVRKKSLGVTGTRGCSHGAEIRWKSGLIWASCQLHWQLAAWSCLCVPDLDQFISTVRSSGLVSPPSIPTVCCGRSLGFLRLTDCNQVEMVGVWKRYLGEIYWQPIMRGQVKWFNVSQALGPIHLWEGLLASGARNGFC